MSLIAPSAAALVPLYAPGVCLHWVISTGFCPCLSSHFLPYPFQPYTIFPVSLCAVLIACLLCLHMCVSTFLAEYLAASGTPYRLACVSIPVALPGCTVAVRPHSGHEAALLHTLELRTPGVPTVVHFCAVVTSIFSTVLPLFVCVLYLSFLIRIMLMGTGDVHSLHSNQRA